jgi:hypothetical protein
MKIRYEKQRNGNLGFLVWRQSTMKDLGKTMRLWGVVDWDITQPSAKSIRFSVEELKTAGVREHSIPRQGLPWAPPPIVVRGEWLLRPQ